MATSQSVTYETDAERVWVAVVRLVTGAGYPIIGTDQAAKQIAYEASGGGWAWAQEVQISVTGLGETEAMVTVLVESAGQATFTEGGQQSKLIQYVLDELGKQFPLAETQHGQANAPGTSGCLGILLAMSAFPFAMAFCFVFAKTLMQ